jgi:F0F1-type ATP synthase delta subunit
MLDIILKHDEKIMFIEAKHLKEGGGTQDKQVHELINIIQTRNSNKNVLVGAFLDGVLSNHILDMSEEYIKNPKKLNYEKNKTVRQQVDIIKALKTNKNNFWFNTAGFKKFIKDF